MAENLNDIFEGFNRVKTRLSNYIKQTEADNRSLDAKNKVLTETIKSNTLAAAANQREIRRAAKGIKQINKITGGK
jgi:hypothetical protein